MNKHISIPKEITTDKDKVEFALNAFEALRLAHNEKGAERREGKMTQEEWLKWQKTIADPLMEEALSIRNDAEDRMRQSGRYSVDAKALIAAKEADVRK